MGRLLYIGAIISLLSVSCSKRISVFETRSSEVTQEEDGLVLYQDDLYFIFDFWSHGGEPFISVYNDSERPKEINLHRSEARYLKQSTSLYQHLNNSVTFKGFKKAYPELLIKRCGMKEVCLEIPPQQWTGFTFTSLAQGRIRKGNTMRYSFAISDGERASLASCSFEATEVKRISNREINAFQLSNYAYDKYFFDRHAATEEIFLSIFNLSMGFL